MPLILTAELGLVHTPLDGWAANQTHNKFPIRHLSNRFSCANSVLACVTFATYAAQNGGSSSTVKGLAG